MIKKVYHLATCSTCKRIIKELNLTESFELQNVKEQPITETELNKLQAFSGSFESLLNRRSVLYRERNLKEQLLTEDDCKKLILEHYSFLKRPIIQVDDHYFIGNAKKTIEAAKTYLENL
ncbi:arsenate reductase family protein [Aquimarina agarilytica]|uniref:arsenate reductase family protein n=1 Tax=Aquimarina agarilytica TaxID=1087449 RepID=UPI00028A18AB|nr:ArsC/Spx/MgsR family protein [Aquimarina agarilytica]